MAPTMFLSPVPRLTRNRFFDFMTQYLVPFLKEFWTEWDPRVRVSYNDSEIECETMFGSMLVQGVEERGRPGNTNRWFWPPRFRIYMNVQWFPDPLAAGFDLIPRITEFFARGPLVSWGVGWHDVPVERWHHLALQVKRCYLSGGFRSRSRSRDRLLAIGDRATASNRRSANSDDDHEAAGSRRSAGQTTSLSDYAVAEVKKVVSWAIDEVMANPAGPARNKAYRQFCFKYHPDIVCRGNCVDETVAFKTAVFQEFQCRYNAQEP
jgi:hypothetical protein